MLQVTMLHNVMWQRAATSILKMLALITDNGQERAFQCQGQSTDSKVRHNFMW